jgi:hypothetical protein
VQIVQALKPGDKPHRFQFAKRRSNVLCIRERMLNMGTRKPSRRSRNRKKQRKDECLVCFLCSEVLGPFSCPEQIVTAMAYLDILQLNLLLELEDHQPNVAFQQYDAPPHWAHIIEEFLDMGTGLGVMDQFRGLRVHPVLYRLIYSYGHTLRTLFKIPL